MPHDPTPWLIFSALPRIGPRTFRRLWQRFPDLDEAIAADPAQLRALGLGSEALALLLQYRRQPAGSPLVRTLERTETWLAKTDCHLLTWADSAYPPLLREIADAPPLLYLQGDPETLSCPQLAIVGSRNATLQGSALARAFATQLLQHGLLITSGLALGIDTAAHQGALEAGGPTLAVLGTGVDHIYPARNRELAARIVAEGGALISELPLGSPPVAQNFPRRNRIISGLALGVLVVEASPRSGSLITARYALEQGREVFALPGSVHSPQSRGCHALIRQGAKLVEEVDHLLEELPALLDACQAARQEPAPPPASAAVSSAAPAGPALSARAERLLAAFGGGRLSVDELVALTGLPTPEVLSELLELELLGLVQAVPGGIERCY